MNALPRRIWGCLSSHGISTRESLLSELQNEPSLVRSIYGIGDSGYRTLCRWVGWNDPSNDGSSEIFKSFSSCDFEASIYLNGSSTFCAGEYSGTIRGRSRSGKNRITLFIDVDHGKGAIAISLFGPQYCARNKARLLGRDPINLSKLPMKGRHVFFSVIKSKAGYLVLDRISI